MNSFDVFVIKGFTVLDKKRNLIDLGPFKNYFFNLSVFSAVYCLILTVIRVSKDNAT